MVPHPADNLTETNLESSLGARLRGYSITLFLAFGLCLFLVQSQMTTAASSMTLNKIFTTTKVTNVDQHFEPLHCNNTIQERQLVGLLPNPVQNASLYNGTLTVGPYVGWGQSSIGNVMSGYFGRLSFAVLGGYDFYSVGGLDPAEAGFVSHFPQNISAVPPQHESMQRLCHSGCCLPLVHTCAHGWSDIANLARSIIQQALLSFLEENDLQQPAFEPTDWLIYDRMLLPNPDRSGEEGFGVSTLSVYDRLPKGNYTLYILESPRREGHLDLYKSLLLERDRFLATQRQRATVVKLPPLSVSEDFARVVFAPNLLLAASGSSFSLWGALGNKGNVLLPRYFQHQNFDGYPPNVQVLRDQRILQNPNVDQITASLYNVSIPVTGAWFETPEGKMAVQKAWIDKEF